MNNLAEVICRSRDAVCNSIRQEIAASHRRLILTDVNLQIFKDLLKYNGNNNDIVAQYSQM